MVEADVQELESPSPLLVSNDAAGLCGLAGDLGRAVMCYIVTFDREDDRMPSGAVCNTQDCNFL